MKQHILLAGNSASGKSTLARALMAGKRRDLVSTSTILRRLMGKDANPPTLFRTGETLDQKNPGWLEAEVSCWGNCVVDAIRSDVQDRSFHREDAIRVQVRSGALAQRHLRRGTESGPSSWEFPRPDFIWNSDRMSIGTAVAAINQLTDAGAVDLLIGGQYGSEGKGKLAALIAPRYGVLVRSGGPNAGHWVRDDHYQFCFHHLPSGTMANRHATVVIAAGATLNPHGFFEEVKLTECGGRIHVDPNVVLIENEDRMAESRTLVGLVGSTAQGVGAATARRVMRGMLGDPVRTAHDDPRFSPYGSGTTSSALLAAMSSEGRNVLIEGTQGSALSIWHGEYPFTTSRDTNASGLIAEVGVAPSAVRDTWMVVRSLPIRVGGNSGPMPGEITWEEVALRIGIDPLLLKSRELTSTTKRQRRVGSFDWTQFAQAVYLNRPTRLFLTFADYLHPDTAGVTEWAKLPDPVREFVVLLQERSGVPVAGISTGPTQREVVWTGDYGQ